MKIYVWNYIAENWEPSEILLGCRFRANEHCLHAGQMLCKACHRELHPSAPPRSIFVGHAGPGEFDQFLLLEPITCGLCGAVNEQFEAPCLHL